MIKPVAALDNGKCIMGMNTLVIDGLYTVGGNSLIGLETKGNIAD